MALDLLLYIDTFRRYAVLALLYENNRSMTFKSSFIVNPLLPAIS